VTVLDAGLKLLGKSIELKILKKIIGETGETEEQIKNRLIAKLSEGRINPENAKK